MKRSLILALVALLVVALVPVASAQTDGPVTFTVVVNNTSAPLPASDGGVFNTPIDADEPGPAFPGSGYSFDFHAEAGEHLSFLTMLVQSNDLFFAPAPEGITLWDGEGNPISGDVTDQILLWDAGTEVNETPGEGPNQAPRQAGPNTGADEYGVVSLVDDGFSYPAVAEYVRVTLEAHDSMMTDDMGRQGWTLTIENISADSSLAGPLAPGVFAAHSPEISLFSDGAPANAGVEAIAEDGNPAIYGALLSGYRLATPITPVVWVVHPADVSAFTVGEPASAGLENLAEDGNPAILAEELAGLNTGVSPIPFGAEEAGPALPGSGYEFTFEANLGDVLTFVTMFVQSNDLFLSLNSVPLFDADGHPITGDRSDEVGLYDAGTEVNEPLGVGPNQAPRQAGPNTGADEMGVVTVYEYMGDMMADDMMDDMSDDDMSDDDMDDDMDDMADDDMDDMSDDDMSDDDMDDMGDMDDMSDDMMGDEMMGGTPVGVISVIISAN